MMTEQKIPKEQPSAEQRSSVWRWWKGLDEDRAGRAELRRCGTVAEVAFTAPYHRLLRRLGSRLGETDARRVALLAGVIAHVDDEPTEDISLPRRMGRANGEGQGAVISDVRFRHLLRSEEPDDLLRELVRVLRQLDRKAAVDPLFRDLMCWDEPTRMRWARDYYEAAPDLPTKR
jgi:CRISPR system Cascade subunit CasB